MQELCYKVHKESINGGRGVFGVKKEVEQNKQNRIIDCSRREKAAVLLKGGLLLSVIAILFYDSLLAALFLTPLLCFFYKRERGKCMGKKEEALALHFKEMLLSVLSALRAGYSVENAFVEAQQDLQYRFGEKDLMVRQLLSINRQVRNNVPVEALLERFAMESRLRDIRDFAHVFRIAKRSGGDMGRIMERTINIITRRMEVKEEIRMLVAAKRYEQQIMNVVPIGIILYIRLSNPGYFNSLYHNMAGIMIMSVALVIYAASYLLSERILEILI